MKKVLISDQLADLVGRRLEKYETAEILRSDDSWESWNDLPIRFFVDGREPVSVAWSKFDELWIETGYATPFSIDGDTVRWVANSISSINLSIGQKVLGVLLGKDEVVVAPSPSRMNSMEIWPRLVLSLEKGWLEVFNALDENDYAFHANRPIGEFIKCL